MTLLVSTLLFMLGLVVISCFLMPARFDRAIRRERATIPSLGLIRVLRSRK